LLTGMIGISLHVATAPDFSVHGSFLVQNISEDVC
jgi:hypothetical protein